MPAMPMQDDDGPEPVLDREVATTRDVRDITRGYVSGTHYLWPQDELLRTLGAGRSGYRLYEEMLQDDRVYAALAQRRAAVVARETEVVPGGDSAADKAAAEFVDELLEDAADESFTSEASPDGTPCALLVDSTRTRRSARGTWPGSILQETGGRGLAGSISSEYGNDHAVAGTNKVYAATHQFGAERGGSDRIGEVGRSQGGHPGPPVPRGRRPTACHDHRCAERPLRPRCPLAQSSPQGGHFAPLSTARFHFLPGVTQDFGR